MRVWPCVRGRGHDPRASLAVERGRLRLWPEGIRGHGLTVSEAVARGRPGLRLRGRTRARTRGCECDLASAARGSPATIRQRYPPT